MEKKVEDILEAFENHRFEDALRQIGKKSRERYKKEKCTYR